MEHTSQATTKIDATHRKEWSTWISLELLSHSRDDVFISDVMKTTPDSAMHTVALNEPLSALASKHKWTSQEYRQAYMEAAVGQTIAWQIKINRERRGLSQKDLAKMVGTTQPAIARAEDPEYGKHSIATLVKIANAFDCALEVKLTSYSELAYQSFRLGEEYLYAADFVEEVAAARAPKEISHATEVHPLR